MFANIEALVALAQYGTMTSAASHLNLTQSAVSKRIAQLEYDLGRQLIEKSGKYVILTPAGTQLLGECRPLIAELKRVLQTEISENIGQLSVALTESVLLSFGARTLYRVQSRMPGISLEMYSARATLVTEAVRSGESMVAIAPGLSENAPDLQAEKLCEETVVIVPRKLKPFRISSGKKINVITVHQQHEVSNFIARGIRRGRARWGISVEIEETYNTFAMVTELAIAGFGHGLVTKGLAKRMGVPESKMIPFPKPGVQVPISLIGRSSTLAKPLIRNFKEMLLASLPSGYRD